MPANSHAFKLSQSKALFLYHKLTVMSTAF